METEKCIDRTCAVRFGYASVLEGKFVNLLFQRKGNRVAILSELGIDIQQTSKGKKISNNHTLTIDHYARLLSVCSLYIDLGLYRSYV